jgi:hypothetical protein
LARNFVLKAGSLFARSKSSLRFLSSLKSNPQKKFRDL